MNKKTFTIGAIYVALIIFITVVVVLTSFFLYFYKNREFKTSNLTFDGDTKVITSDMYSIDIRVNDNCDLNFSKYKIDYVKEDDLLIAYVFIYGTYMDKKVADEDGVFNLKVPIGDADKITFYGDNTKKTLWIKD